MAKLEIPVQVYMDNLDEMIDELKQLQTYKLYEGAEKVLVDCDEVVKVFRKHLQTKVGKPEIINCKECVFYQLRNGYCEMNNATFLLFDFCSKAERREG